jgi:hypothetical protein
MAVLSSAPRLRVEAGVAGDRKAKSVLGFNRRTLMKATGGVEKVMDAVMTQLDALAVSAR